MTGWLQGGYGWLRDGYVMVMRWLRIGYGMVMEWLRGVSRAVTRAVVTVTVTVNRVVTGWLRNGCGVVTVRFQGGNGGFGGPKS